MRDLITYIVIFSFFLVKVFADLLADPEQLLMVTVSNALLEIGYAIEVYICFPLACTVSNVK